MKAGSVLVLVLMVLVGMQGNPFNSTPNEKVIDKVKEHNKHAPWMKHVTDWGSTMGITVTTDYPYDKIDSYAVAEQICSAVTDAYDENTNDKPGLRVYGVDSTTKNKVDGSKETDTDKVRMAESTSRHDFRCGMTPPDQLLKQAKDYTVPVYE